MAKQSKKQNTAESDRESDWIWGAEAIARELNCSRSRIYSMLAAGRLGGAVRKFGHRSIAASRSGLRNLITT